MSKIDVPELLNFEQFKDALQQLLFLDESVEMERSTGVYSDIGLDSIQVLEVVIYFEEKGCFLDFGLLAQESATLGDLYDQLIQSTASYAGRGVSYSLSLSQDTED